MRAVVIGAGVAGLMAAKVLARHVNGVRLIEPERLPDRPAPRKGTPQDWHVHALLKSGEGVLSDLYPKFRQNLRDAGGHEFAFRSQWRTFGPNGWVDPVDIGLKMLSQTRPLVEHLVRRETLSDPAVELLEGRAVGLVARDGRMAGVALDTAGGRLILEADIVVDASGRSGRILQSLRRIGAPLPPGEMMKPELRYTSALYSRRITSGTDFGGWLMFPQAPETRGAVALPVENERWLVTAFDRFGRQVPAEPEGFREFLRALPDRKFVDLLRGEEPVSAFKSYRIADVYLRHFDSIARELPAGYIPMGDVIATFNPIYAQGISVAALQAKALDEALATEMSRDGSTGGLAEAYLPAATQPARWAWQLGQATDLRYREVEGERTERTAAFSDVLQEVLRIGAHEPSITAAHGRVIHLLAPPDHLSEVLNTVMGQRRRAEENGLKGS